MSNAQSPGDDDDLAETKRKLEARIAELSESKHRYDLAVQATTDGIWDWNIATNEEYFAPRWCNILGFEHDDPALSHTYSAWADRIHPEDRARVEAAVQAHLEHGHTYDVTYRHRHRSGEYRWQNSRGLAVRDEHGKPVRMVGAIRDVTRLKEAENAVVEANEALERRVAQRTEELRQSNEELERFAYAASHDLRAPLRGIEALVGFLREDMASKLTEENSAMMDKLVGRVRRMDSLLIGLLELGEIGNRSGPHTAIDLNALVREVHEDLGPEAESATIVVDRPLPTLRANRVSIASVFSNLIGNAIKHSDKQRPRVDVNAEPYEEGWRFRIGDDGPGIPKDLRHKAMSMFETLRSRDEVEGSGLGLTLARKRIVFAGGRMTLGESRFGGCEVTFTWPQPKEVEDPGASTTTGSTPSI